VLFGIGESHTHSSFNNHITTIPHISHKGKAMTVSTPQYIMVQEEYGYRHWIGVLPSEMTREDVISWWKALPSVRGMFFNPSGTFPMPLIELEDIADDDAVKATWQWFDEQGQEHILDRSNVVLFVRVHEDDNSYMKIPQGDVIYHAGYGEYDEVEDDTPTDQELIEEAQKYPTLKSLVENIKEG
jgi:hypothetical protein